MYHAGLAVVRSGGPYGANCMKNVRHTQCSLHLGIGLAPLRSTTVPGLYCIGLHNVFLSILMKSVEGKLVLG